MIVWSLLIPAKTLATNAYVPRALNIGQVSSIPFCCCLFPCFLAVMHVGSVISKHQYCIVFLPRVGLLQANTATTGRVTVTFLLNHAVRMAAPVMTLDMMPTPANVCWALMVHNKQKQATKQTGCFLKYHHAAVHLPFSLCVTSLP